jgi:hypothetical protein
LSIAAHRAPSRARKRCKTRCVGRAMGLHRVGRAWCWKHGRAGSCMRFRGTLAPKPGGVADEPGGSHFCRGQASARGRVPLFRVLAYAVLVEGLHAVEVFPARRALAPVAGELGRVDARSGLFGGFPSGRCNTLAGVARGLGSTSARGRTAGGECCRRRAHAASLAATRSGRVRRDSSLT